MSLRFCSYNMGTNQDDYHRSLIYNHLSFSKGEEPFSLSEEEFGAAWQATLSDLENRYQEVEKAAADGLLQDEVRAHVYCFQEVGNLNRPLIQKFRERGFLFFHVNAQNYLDSVVAVDPERFQVLGGDLVMRDEQNGADIGLVKLKDRLTGYTLVAASLHVPGFSFRGLELERGSGKSPEGPQVGDRHCKWVADQLNQPGLSHQMAFIGADMNAIYSEGPCPGEWNPRYEKFTDRSFTPLLPQNPTNVNPWYNEPEGTHLRPIDAGFIRYSEDSAGSFWERIASRVYNFFFDLFSAPEAVIREDLDPLNGFNPETNASDHKPLFFEVSFGITPSSISQIFSRSVPPERTAW